MSVEEKVAKAVAEEPIVFEIANRRGRVGSLLAKMNVLPKARRFTIYPATLGMHEQMSAYSEKIDLREVATVGEAILSVGGNARLVCQFLAVAVMRDSKAVAEVAVNELAEFFLYNLTAKNLSDLVGVVLKQSDIAFFLSTLNLVGVKKKASESQEESITPLGQSPEVQ